MKLLKTLKKFIYRVLTSAPVVAIGSKIFKIVAATGKNSGICLKNGFLPIPVHFYSPVPDISDLEQRNIWEIRSKLPGIDLNPELQMEFLSLIGKDYAEECVWPPEQTGNPAEFYVNNPSFSYGCAAATHCMIKKFTPRTFVEVGSGMSSLIISKALSSNTQKSNYIIVDPYPNDVIRNKLINLDILYQSRVETLTPSFFDQLITNDILFIDSGHCVRIGGDVNFLLLDVLPRLNPGVIIHFHDISLPYEYPKAYAIDETFRQFWTEQYMLQSFLSCNRDFEILLAMNYLMNNHKDFFKKTFNHYDPSLHKFISGSFWIRRKVQV